MRSAASHRLFARAWLALGYAFLYVPIVALVVYSFNDSPVANVWRGFTLEWYRKLADDRELLGGPQNLMIGRVIWDENFSNNDPPMASAVAVILVMLIVVPLALFNKYQTEAQERRACVRTAVPKRSYRSAKRGG